MICLEKSKNLKPHEMVDRKHLSSVMGDLIRDGVLREPVIIDRETKIILDGHHRCEALKKLGFSRVPVFPVDYSSPEIEVVSRNGLKVSKELVIRKGLGGDPYPPKTTKHIIPKTPKNINIELEMLK